MPFQSNLHHVLKLGWWHTLAPLILIEFLTCRDDSVNEGEQEQEQGEELGETVLSSPAEPAKTEKERPSVSTTCGGTLSPEQHAAEAEAFYHQKVGLVSMPGKC